MRILLLGATGRTGRLILQYALRDGHEVTVLVRSADKLREQLFTSAVPLLHADGHPLSRDAERLPESFAQQIREYTDIRSWQREEGISLHILSGDTRSSDHLRCALQGVDAVISAIGTDRSDALTVTFHALVPLMQKYAVPRLIAIGTAGILQSRTLADKYRYETSESRQRSTRAAEEHRKVYELLQASNLQWTLVCPTYLPEGAYTGGYRLERDRLPEGGKQISTGDTAYFTYLQLRDERYLSSRVGIAY